MPSMDRKTDSYAKQLSADITIFVRDVRSKGKKRPVTLRPWATVKDLKDNLQKLIHIPTSSQRLYFGPLLTSGKPLPNHRTLQDAAIEDGDTVLLDIKSNSTDSSGDSVSSIINMSNANDLCLSTSMLDSTPKPLRKLVQAARHGMAVGLKPDFALDGSGGTYFFHDSRKNKIAVFKPADEEPYAENNPRGYLSQQPGDSLRAGIVPGEACIREVAAYLLDKDGFSGVPMTTLIEARHPAFNNNGSRLSLSQGGASVGAHSIALSPSASSLVSKPGSFQEFVRSECSMDDISPTKISVEEVHKIAILDIRIMNADRNSANLIVCQRPDNSLELVPIDHGYCLRSVCDVCWMDWCWLDWPQMKQPLSAKHKQYINDLDIDKDARMLRDSLNICEEAIDYFRASSALLKAGVAAGLTLYDIAVMCCRNDDLAETPSMMEKLFDMAAELAHVAVANERWHHTAASRAIVEHLSISNSLQKPSTASMGGTIAKSYSSAAFLTLANLSSDHSIDRIDDFPGLVNSCASDTSSDVEDEDIAHDNEDCEKWAQKVIADVSLDQIVPRGRPRRSDSVNSSSSDDGSSSTSSEGHGFWRVRPGSVDPESHKDSKTHRLSSTSKDDASFDDDDENLSACTEVEEDVKPCNVSFAECTVTKIEPPRTVNFTNLKPMSIPPAKKNGMKRSKSYSALTVKDRPTKTGNMSAVMQRINHDNYKKYFHKFIDLVIVRETSVALHHSRRRTNRK